jgi:hypothetical protein
MQNRISVAVGTLALVSSAFAQNYQRQATIRGGGGPDRGKCTIEVVVDDVAQVEIRGATANLRTISGQPAQWRRFECDSVMPPNPQNFRFTGVDGRGRQSLVRDPRNGGAAVVEIDDKDGGAEGYTFDITWGGYGGPVSGGQPPVYDRGGPPPAYDRGGQPPVYDRGGEYRWPEPDYRPGYRDGDYYRRWGHGFGQDEAVRTCESAAISRAQDRFRTSDVHILNSRIDDGPGRNDWVIGRLDVHYRGGREDRFRFSCSVDFQAGRVRTVDVDERPLPAFGRYQ